MASFRSGCVSPAMLEFVSDSVVIRLDRVPQRSRMPRNLFLLPITSVFIYNRLSVRNRTRLESPLYQRSQTAAARFPSLSPSTTARHRTAPTTRNHQGRQRRRGRVAYYVPAEGPEKPRLTTSCTCSGWVNSVGMISWPPSPTHRCRTTEVSAA